MCCMILSELIPYLQPYVGAGVGYQWAQDRNVYTDRSPRAVLRVSKDTKGSFAYQGIIGAAIPVAGAPGLAFTADYRFMGMSGERDYGGERPPSARSIQRL